MSTVRFAPFARPEIIRSIEPRRLARFLEPYRQELAARGLKLPTEPAFAGAVGEQLECRWKTNHATIVPLGDCNSLHINT